MYSIFKQTKRHYYMSNKNILAAAYLQHYVLKNHISIYFKKYFSPYLFLQIYTSKRLGNARAELNTVSKTLCGLQTFLPPWVPEIELYKTSEYIQVTESWEHWCKCWYFFVCIIQWRKTKKFNEGKFEEKKTFKKENFKKLKNITDYFPLPSCWRTLSWSYPAQKAMAV